VDGIPTEQYLIDSVIPYVSSSTEQILWDWAIRGVQGNGLLQGPPLSLVQITLGLPAGGERTVTVCRNYWTKKRREPESGPSDFKLLEFKQINPEIACVSLNSFSDRQIVAEFDSQFGRLQKSKGIIIDLRKNGGGSTGTGAAIVKYLTADTLIGSSWRTRLHMAAMKAWASFGAKKYKDYLTGEVWYSEPPDTLIPGPGPKLTMPVAVLIGRKTASAAEDFLVYLDKVENVTLIGEPTFGSTGQPLMVDLPGGGKARICTKRDSYPDGREFVGYGIQPDILVRATVESIRNGTDPVLERAVSFLENRIQ
jgi:C-terminal processing protease CtpA/Prc